MWKTALLSLAVALSTAQGSFGNRLGVESWDHMLAELMQRNVQTGTCGDKCYVNAGGDQRVLERGGSFVHSSDPCLQYICESSGVREEKIQCPPVVTCDNGAPVRYADQCCLKCEGPSDVPVEFEEWGPWTECSTTCGGGKQARQRTCKIPEGADAVNCVGVLKEVRECNNNPCPVNCEWEWGEYESCTKPCGGGEKSRFPIITQHSQHAGKPCPPNVRNNVPDTTSCNTQPCSQPCTWKPWREWSACSKTCGGGTRTRTRGKNEALHGGKDCEGPSSQREDCNTNPCPVDCDFEWGEFSECSKSCGGGTMTRSPTIRRHGQYGGTPCPSSETETCNEQSCPVCKAGYNMCAQHTECVPDQDMDCIEDSRDNCVAVANTKQDDEDGDGVGDACDNCIYASNTGQENNDGDLTGDECDEDDDNDGHADNNDLCGKVYSPDNRDRDGDGAGDCCDDCTMVFGRCRTRDQLYRTDSDGDGLPDECDNCPNHYNPEQTADSNGNLPCQRQQISAQTADNNNTPVISDADKKTLANEIMEKLLEMYYSN